MTDDDGIRYVTVEPRFKQPPAEKPPRKPLRQKTPLKAKRAYNSQMPESVHAKVRGRSGGRCEIVEETRCTRWATAMHHRRRRSQGGEDIASNILHICEIPHHVWIHANPTAAHEKGWLKGTVA